MSTTPTPISAAPESLKLSPEALQQFRDIQNRPIEAPTTDVLDLIPAQAPAPAAEAKIKPLTKISLHELRKGNFAEPESIFKDLLYPGLTIFAGRPKSGKSWFTLQLAGAAASGAIFLGRFAPKGPLTVLYLALEEPQYRTVKRSRMVGISTDESVDGNIHFVYRGEVLPMMGGGLLQLEKTITLEKPDIIIIDSLMAFRGASRKSKADIVSDDYNEMKAVHDLAEKHGLCIVLIHHTRKAAADYGPDALLGTSGTSAAVDAIWTLQPPRKPKSNRHDEEPEEDDKIQEFDARGRDCEDLSLALRRDGDENHVQWVCLEAGHGVDVLFTSQQRWAVWECLKKGFRTIKDIAKQLDKGEDAVRQMLHRLQEEGQVRNVAQRGLPGEYEIAPDADKPPAPVKQGSEFLF